MTVEPPLGSSETTSPLPLTTVIKAAQQPQLPRAKRAPKPPSNPPAKTICCVTLSRPFSRAVVIPSRPLAAPDVVSFADDPLEIVQEVSNIARPSSGHRGDILRAAVLQYRRSDWATFTPLQALEPWKHWPSGAKPPGLLTPTPPHPCYPGRGSLWTTVQSLGSSAHIALAVE